MPNLFIENGSFIYSPLGYIDYSSCHLFGNQLRREAAVAVAWNIDGQGTEIALERLGAAAVAGVAAFIAHRFMLVVAQMDSQFGLAPVFRIP